jgi:hypothetical protein
MPDNIRKEAQEMADLRQLQAAAAHVPDAARHQANEVKKLGDVIEAKFQAGTLEARPHQLWQAHRATTNQAVQRAREVATQWDADFPIFHSEVSSD